MVLHSLSAQPRVGRFCVAVAKVLWLVGCQRMLGVNKPFVRIFQSVTSIPVHSDHSMARPRCTAEQRAQNARAEENFAPQELHSRINMQVDPTQRMEVGTIECRVCAVPLDLGIPISGAE